MSQKVSRFAGYAMCLPIRNIKRTGVNVSSRYECLEAEHAVWRMMHFLVGVSVDRAQRFSSKGMEAKDHKLRMAVRWRGIN